MGARRCAASSRARMRGFARKRRGGARARALSARARVGMRERRPREPVGSRALARARRNLHNRGRRFREGVAHARAPAMERPTPRLPPMPTQRVQIATPARAVTAEASATGGPYRRGGTPPLVVEPCARPHPSPFGTSRELFERRAPSRLHVGLFEVRLAEPQTSSSHGAPRRARLAACCGGFRALEYLPGNTSPFSRASVAAVSSSTAMLGGGSVHALDSFGLGTARGRNRGAYPSSVREPPASR